MRIITRYAVLAGAVLIVALTVPAQAFPRSGRIVVAPRIVVPGYYSGSPWGPYYDPFWGPYYLYGYPAVGGQTADIRVDAVPKQADVFIDGYRAGTVDDFDGHFQHLRTTPGGHTVTLFLPGYRTASQHVYVEPGSTFTLHDTMQPLASGEVSQDPPLPGRPVRPSARSSRPSQG